MSKKFNRFLRRAAQMGIDVGDINQASAMFLGQPAQTPTPQAPTPPPTPEIIKPPKQSIATQSAAGQGVRTSRKAKKRTRLSDLRIRRPRQQVNTSLSIGAGGTGLNVGGY
jgi:flagellar motility protein MotE (MotC chaperone)